jgi:hypothetical protein
MHHDIEVSDITIAALDDAYAEQVAAGIPADSLSDAHRIVSRLTSLAKVCPTPKPSPTASSSPTRKASSKAKQNQQKKSRTPSAKKSPNASGSKSPSAKPTKTPSPSPTPTIAPPECIKATP